MEFQISDAIVMIGELHYEKRMLEEELKTARQQIVQLFGEKQTAEAAMAELEAGLNGHSQLKIEEVASD